MKTERDQMRKEDLSLNQMENEHQDQDQITQEAKAVHHQGLLRHKLQDIGLDFPELEYLSFEGNSNESPHLRSSSPGGRGPWGGVKGMAMGDCFRF